MAYPDWWHAMAREVEAAGRDKWSASWYAAMRDLYIERFPEADARSLENMRSFVAHAEAREAVARCAGK